MMDCEPEFMFPFGQPLQRLRLWAAVNKLSCSSSIHDKTLEQWLEEQEQYEFLSLINRTDPSWLAIITDDPATTLMNRDWASNRDEFDRIYSQHYSWGDD